MDLQATLTGSFTFTYLEATPVFGRLLGVIGSSVTDILTLAYRGLTMEGGTFGIVVFLVTSNVMRS
jgi:hypothetical protein